MADLYQNLPDIAQKAQENERRRRIAEAMMAQNQQPLTPFVSTGRMVAPVSWAQGLSQLANAYVDKQDIKKYDSIDAALAAQVKKRQDEAMAKFQTRSAGTPAVPEIPAAPAQGPQGPMPSVGPPQPGREAVAGDPRGAALELMGNPAASPQAAQAAMLGLNLSEKDADRSEDRAFRLQNLILTLQARADDRNLDAASRAEAAKQLGEVRLEAARIAAAGKPEPAPAYRDIIDPKDPTRLITVDGRLYSPGGSLGDPGVIGVAGKEPAALKAQETRGVGAKAADEQIATLRALYDELDKGGGIVNPERGALANIKASAQASGVGQVLGGMVGTDNQTARDTIAMTRPALLRSVMAATGMSARSVDSNAELKLWLSTATDPQKSVKANRAALDSLEKFIGSGGKYTEHGGTGGAIPGGLDAETWNHMTPEQQALFK